MTTITPRYGATALHMAAAAGHLSTVKAVLQAGGHHHHHPHYHGICSICETFLLIVHFIVDIPHPTYHDSCIIMTGLVEEDTMSRLSSCPSPTMIGALHGRDVVLRFVSSPSACSLQVANKSLTSDQEFAVKRRSS